MAGATWQMQSIHEHLKKIVSNCVDVERWLCCHNRFIDY